MANTQGNNRFEFYLIKLETLLQQAANEKNAALWLYTNNARTPLFMLEGLAKLYAGIQNKNRFEKLKEHFKILEDTLGAIDYYDSFSKEFAANSNIPPVITDYLQGQAREKIQQLNELLHENKWMGEIPSPRIKKIRKKLSGADWKEPKQELKGIFDFYKRAIAEIKEFMLAADNNFTEIETQVHAMRRKLRWLSIYPQALQGLIHLKESNIANENIKKYLVPDIVNSSFNKMPEPGDNSYLLLFDKNYFLSLSWLISELGKLKDRGLRIMSVTEALQQTETISHELAFIKAHELLGESKNALPQILSNATAICNTFLAENNLDKLIDGIRSAKKEKA